MGENVRVGYLDQHAVLAQGMTIRDVLKTAFTYLFEMEEKMNEICDQLGTADEETMTVLMDELGTIQDMLTMHDFYVIDAKVEEIARAFGLLEIRTGQGRHRSERRSENACAAWKAAVGETGYFAPG